MDINDSVSTVETDAYTVKVNLCRYPRFWRDFLRVVPKGLLVRSDQCKIMWRERYNLDVYIQGSDLIGIVYMRPQDAAWFNLQWS